MNRKVPIILRYLKRGIVPEPRDVLEWYSSKVKLQNDDCKGHLVSILDVRLKVKTRTYVPNTYVYVKDYIYVKHAHICQTRTYLSNMYVCAKHIHMCQNIYICAKHVRLCQTYTYVPNMYVCAKHIRIVKHVHMCQTCMYMYVYVKHARICMYMSNTYIYVCISQTRTYVQNMYICAKHVRICMYMSNTYMCQTCTYVSNTSVYVKHVRMCQHVHVCICQRRTFDNVLEKLFPLKSEHGHSLHFFIPPSPPFIFTFLMKEQYLVWTYLKCRCSIYVLAFRRLTIMYVQSAIVSL